MENIMINLTQNSFISEDQTSLFYYTTPRLKITKGIVIIVHGLAEHAKRYQAFADFLFRNDFSIYALDQRGHGETGLNQGLLGFVSNFNGWQKLISDVEDLTNIASAENPDLPIYLFGHSMGSVVVRSCLCQFGGYYHGAIMSGTTAGLDTMAYQSNKLFVNTLIKKNGPKAPAKRIEKMTFGRYNNKFKPVHTPFDWLSVNAKNVDTYMADPLCGFTATTGFYLDFIYGLHYAHQFKNLQAIPSTLPILYISGAEDPVGKNGKEVKDLYNRTKKAGVKDVDLILYPDKRHEILNEYNNIIIYEDILKFLNK